MPYPPITALLCDMNGLFRHWYNTGAHTGQTLAQLPEGTIAAYAYQHPTYHLARVGVLTDQQWADDVTRRLSADFGPKALDAIAPWRADRGTPDPAMTDILAQARRHLPVGVLSNTTDALRADLAHHDITFDFVFPSAELGVDKPSPHAFRLAAQGMSRRPEQLLYFDDEPTFVTAARHAGLRAELFTDPTAFAESLNEHGIPVHIPQHSHAQQAPDPRDR